MSPSLSGTPMASAACPPDLAALAHSLQDIARVLLTRGQDGSEQCNTLRSEPAATQTRSRPEIRMYSVADYILKEEQALLAAYQAEDWQELFQVARGRFETICTLMRHFHEDQEISGFLLQQIAENLMLPNLELLNRLCSLVADFRAPEEQMI